MLTPYGVVVVTALLSFGAWLFPSFDYFVKGFSDREPISYIALGFLVSWYGLILMFAYIGYHLPIAKKIKIGGSPIYSLDNDKLYLLYTIIATLGVGYAYYLIVSNLGIIGVLVAIATNSANDLKGALYENYSAGLPSLRYLSIITCGLAFYKTFKRGLGAMEAYNITLLIITALISSRLAFISASMIGFTLIVSHGGLKKIDFKKIIKYCTLFFGVIIIMTYVRTYGTYSREGIENPIAAAFSEIITYLGAPFQVFLGLGNNIHRVMSGESYFNYIDVLRTLTTNSALQDLIFQFGYWSYPLMCVTAFAFALAMKIALKNKDSFIFIFFPVSLYAFAEIWRIYLFQTGLFHTLVIFSFVFPLAMNIVLRGLKLDFMHDPGKKHSRYLLLKREKELVD